MSSKEWPVSRRLAGTGGPLILLSTVDPLKYSVHIAFDRMSSGKRKRDGMLPRSKASRASSSGSTNPISCDGPSTFKQSSWDPQRKSHGIVWPKLKKIYAIDHIEELPPSIPTHANITAPPSTLPAKKYCDITGYEAPYTHRTGIRYADASVYQYIIEQLDTFERQQEVLEYRGAATRIK